MKRHKFSTNIYTIFNLEIQAAVVKGRQEAHTEFTQCGCKNMKIKNTLSTQKVGRESIWESGKNLGKKNGKTCYFPFL